MPEEDGEIVTVGVGDLEGDMLGVADFVGVTEEEFAQTPMMAESPGTGHSAIHEQRVADTEPGGQRDPMGHVKLHPAEEVTPVSLLNTPPGQGVGATEFKGQKLPALHRVVAPLPAQKKPAGQVANLYIVLLSSATRISLALVSDGDPVTGAAIGMLHSLLPALVNDIKLPFVEFTLVPTTISGKQPKCAGVLVVKVSNDWDAYTQTRTPLDAFTTAKKLSYGRTTRPLPAMEKYLAGSKVPMPRTVGDASGVPPIGEDQINSPVAALSD